MISLKYSCIDWTEYGCLTHFVDGSEVGSFPHDTPHYHVVSHRCGYGDDVLAYCREHDFFHSFCEQFFYDRTSPVLWSLAHGSEVEDSLAEELLVQTCQRWVRTNEQPLIGRVDWDGFKRDVLGALHG